MTPEDAAYARERMERARRAIDDATYLAADGRREAAINRAYYGAFYAASALLATKGLTSRKHSGVMSLFDTEFVLAGVIDREHGSVLHKLFEERGIADYGSFVEFGQDTVEEIINSAAGFVDAVERVLPALLDDD